MRDKLNLINTQKTLIHAFFDGFMNGVTDANDLKPNERQTLIKTLLNVYEKVSEHYAVVMLPILGVVHHETLEQLQCKLDALGQQGDADVTALFKVVCGEEGTYEAMVDDYKANFEALVQRNLISHLYKDQRGTKPQTFGAHHSARLPLWTANKAFIATV